MIHRALMGSYERFIGILLEHFAGELPLWLAPLQVIVLPIADRHNLYGKNLRDRLAAANIRVELDDRTESVGRKIRDAEVRKVPFMLVVGDREQEAGEVGVREHRAGDTGRGRVRRLPRADHGSDLNSRADARSDHELDLSRPLAILPLVDPADFSQPARRRLKHRRNNS